MRLTLALLLALCVALTAAKPAGAATQVEVPANAQLNSRGDGWICSYGFYRVGKACAAITVPRNAVLGPYGDVWVCLPGYITYRGICLPEEGADRDALEAPPKLRPWQLMKKLTASAPSPSQSSSGRSQNEIFYRVGPLIAAAMALGVWMFFFGEREPVARTRNYAGTSIIVKRPQRAVTVNVWQSAGDRVDALTGALVPLAVEVSQCRNCRVFYRKESLVALRRENGGACISCGRAAFQAIAS